MKIFYVNLEFFVEFKETQGEILGSTSFIRWLVGASARPQAQGFSVPIASNDVFPLPNSYSDSYEIGFNDNVQNCLHWTYTDSYCDSYSNSNGYCTQFGTDIGTDKVEFK